MPDAPVPVVIEVTNTLKAPSVTGYQRVVRELVRELSRPGTPALEVIPVVWDVRGGCFRRLTDEEARRLADPAKPPSVVPRSLVQRVLGRAKRELHPFTPAVRSRRMPTLPAGTVFFDCEPSWHNPAARDRLLPSLRAQGVTVVTMVADVLPELHPEWFEPRVVALFHTWLTAQLESTQRFLVISQSSTDELLQVAARDGVVSPPTEVITLGADFGTLTQPREVRLPSAITRYLLLVSTIEPRKNQALALDLLDALDEPGLGLVLVGKQGWLVGDLVDRIRNHPMLGTRLLWLSGIGDDELVWLYQNAFLVLVPSLSEGLGLPVIEALQHGIPPLASTGGAVPEAGGSFAEYAAPDDLPAWVALVRAHLDDLAHHARVKEHLQGYRPPTWADGAQAIRTALYDQAHRV